MISGRTRVAAVIGSPIGHSRSPAIMNAAFAASGLDWVYEAFEVPPGSASDAVAAMRALGIGGLSVTMPHKAAAAASVDRLDDDAIALGAVNCIAWSGDQLIGHNTDGRGFLDALRDDLALDATGLRVVVFGAGGAARAVVRAVARAGAAEVAVVNRTRDRAEEAAALAGSVGRVADVTAVAGADLIVDATPFGMLGDTRVVFDPDLVEARHAVVDLVYDPVQTPLLAAASARGARTANGLSMLVHQAAHAFRHWTGSQPPIEAMRTAAAVSHP